MSESNPTQPAPSAFHHTARAANPAMLVDLYRRAGTMSNGADEAERGEGNRRMDALIVEMARRGLGELAGDLNDEWMAQICLARADRDNPVCAVLGAELARLRVRIRAHVHTASR